MPDRALSSTLTPDELQALLRLAEQEPSAWSPLGEMLRSAAPGSAVGTRHLADGGWLASEEPARLRAECGRALSVLAAPVRALHLKLGSLAGLATLELYNDGASADGWVRLQCEDNGRWGRVEMPLNAEALLERVAGGLDLKPTLAVPPFTATWSWERYLVLLAILDAFRATCLQSILDRSDAPDAVLSSEDLLAAFKLGMSRVHYYWGVSLGTLISPGDMNISKARVDAILEDLVREGLLARRSPTSFGLRRGLMEFAVSLLLLPAFMSLSLRVADDGAWTPRMHVAALRGANALWLLEFFTREDDVRVRVEACQGRDLLGLLREILSAPSPRASTCSQCGLPVPRDGRFCTACGAPLAGQRVS